MPKHLAWIPTALYGAIQVKRLGESLAQARNCNPRL